MNALEMYGGSSGKSFTFTAGLNKNVFVKDWLLEETGENVNLKVNYHQAVENTPKDQWSAISQSFYFPQGQITEGRLKVFIGSIGAFVEQFVSKEDSTKRFKEAVEKYKITSFDLENTSTRNDQIKKIVRAWFDLIQPAFNKPGTLVCGYPAPKEKDGEMKQYLTVARYGQGNWWESPFRTNGKESLPAERTSFSNDAERKYNYWSYTKSSGGEPKAPVVSTDNGNW